MTFLQLNQTNAPFNKEQLALINQLLPMLSTEQQHWLSGYLINPNALESEDDASVAQEPNSLNNAENETNNLTSTVNSSEPIDINILYGTETGNAEEIAETFEGKLKEHNFNALLWDMDDFPKETLADVEHLFIIC